MTHENRHDMLGSKFESINASVDRKMPQNFEQQWMYLKGVFEVPRDDGEKSYVDCLKETSARAPATERAVEYNKVIVSQSHSKPLNQMLYSMFRTDRTIFSFASQQSISEP